MLVEGLDPEKVKSQEMRCPRCHGLMMPIEMKDAVSSESTSGWRCLLCGEVIDSVIAVNRKCHQEPTPSRARLPLAVFLKVPACRRSK